LPIAHKNYSIPNYIISTYSTIQNSISSILPASPAHSPREEEGGGRREEGGYAVLYSTVC
jgi:hypothetical protein